MNVWGNLLSLESLDGIFFLSSCLCIIHKFISAVLLCLQQKPRKRFKRHLLAEGESASVSCRYLLCIVSRN